MAKRGTALILFLLCVAALVPGCLPQRMNPYVMESGMASPLQTPIPTPTPAPTPEPELTPLEQAFQLAEAQIHFLPEDDPRAVFPQGNRSLLTSFDLLNATPYELEWGWREIAARAGIKNFRTHDFTDREWYEPDPDFSRDNLSQTEAMNLINIRNTALVHYANMKIVKNARASADLNGDGKKESFSLSVDRFNNEGTLQIGSTRFTLKHPMLDTKLYLCDIDKDDSYLELAVIYIENGDDYHTAFYRYLDGSLMMIGAVQGDRETLRLFGDGTLDAHKLEKRVFGAWRYRQRWLLRDGVLSPGAERTRYIRLSATLHVDLPVMDADENSFLIPAGDTVWLILLTTANECILYHPGSGKIGMFTIDSEYKINGMSSGEVFGDLPSFA